MKIYYGLWLGSQACYASECHENNFIGVDFGFTQDFSNDLTLTQQQFTKKFAPDWLKTAQNPTKIGAGLACGTVWRMVAGIKEGDVIVCPNGQNGFYIGEITGSFWFSPNSALPQRRTIKWFPKVITTSEVSEALNLSVRSFSTLKDISHHANEIESLINLESFDDVVSDNENSSLLFNFEKELEDFLVKTWSQTALGQKYDIYQIDGQNGQQFKCEAGIIDILAISKDKKELLVVELKRGVIGKKVMGQIQAYMGAIQNMAEEGQVVKGVLIGSEADDKLMLALKVAPNIEFYRYVLDFKLLAQTN
jgi:restriction system protein